MYSKVNIHGKFISIIPKTRDAGKIDELLHVLHEADPLEEADPPFLPNMEEQVRLILPFVNRKKKVYMK